MRHKILESRGINNRININPLFKKLRFYQTCLVKVIILKKTDYNQLAVINVSLGSSVQTNNTVIYKESVNKRVGQKTQ